MSQQIEMLDQPGQRLLQYLVTLLPKVKPGDPRTYTSYKQIHEALGLDQHGQTFGESLKVQGLNSLAGWTAKTSKPGITGLIIDRATLMPGEGYFKLFGRTTDDFGWWREEIERSKSFDWGAYLVQGQDESDSVANAPWTEDELRASVAAYLEMQSYERSGHKFSKSRYYESLSKQFGRGPSAYEYRMQNISYVMSLMGRDWLVGLRPAKNVGSRVAGMIETMIAELEGKPVAPVVAFEIEVRDRVKKAEFPEPQGSDAPRSHTALVTQYQRDPTVKAWVLKAAAGVCECCKTVAPFKGADGFPYLEVHHVIKLAESGPDTIFNAVAVCPNCHRELHYGERAKELVEALYMDVKRLQRGTVSPA